MIGNTNVKSKGQKWKVKKASEKWKFVNQAVHWWEELKSGTLDNHWSLSLHCQMITSLQDWAQKHLRCYPWSPEKDGAMKMFAKEISQFFNLSSTTQMWLIISGETLWRDNCQLIAMLVIVLARQAQKNCNKSELLGRQSSC